MTTALIVDALGELDAQIAELNVQRKAYADQLKSLGDDKHNGMLYDANVFTVTREVPKWKVIAEKAGASRQLIKANSTTSIVTTLKVTARSRQAA